MLGSGLAKLDLGDLEVEVVGLCDRLDGDGAGVVLQSDRRVRRQAS